MSGISDVRKASEAPQARKATGYERRNGQWDRGNRKEPLEKASGQGQGSWLPEQDSVLQGFSQRRGERAAICGCDRGGILGNQIEQARSLIASQEKAIALQLAALEEMKKGLAELERLAAEAESVEEEE